jgi:hypothetical protein
LVGAPEVIRTPDPQIRGLALHPAGKDIERKRQERVKSWRKSGGEPAALIA